MDNIESGDMFFYMNINPTNFQYILDSHSEVIANESC